MSVGCDTVCSACGEKRSLCSDAMSLQLDDGSLAILPHPAERGYAERHGLTLHQAAKRGRLFRQWFSVCQRCGEETYTIRKIDAYPPTSSTSRR